MDFRFSEDQKSIQELSRKIFESEVSEDSLKALGKSADSVHHKVWDALGQAELLGIALPVEHGGGGMGLVELGILLKEQGRVAAPIPLMHSSGIAAMTVAEFGDDALKSRVLRKVASGECVITSALAQSTNLNFLKPAVQAIKGDDGYVLTGNNTCVPALLQADWVLVPASTTDGQVGLFLVNPKDTGVSVERQVTTSFEEQGELSLDGVRVSLENQVGELTSDGSQIRWMVERMWACICALQWGIAERQLEMLAEFAKTRKQFGQPIGAFQAVSQRAGDAFIDLQSMGVTAQQALWRLAAGKEASTEVMIAKYWASQGGHRIAASAQHIHGGMGVDCDYPLFRYSLLARQMELTLGGANQMLARLGSHLATGSEAL
ncbi:MAG: acyl-CoA/acyl-ACP dehydrogenase [Deltaproteobacteria bacterium]|jgi:3-oxocholest-4-en-26-oyl-CoA dehydrogenase beta subunit|nr:acyl-CoA/acyl-ACP dehydrogenase [Deltaproteobacteria bacterium]MBT6436022.1 acyl-CoA/acyl-ACP dehydrogenase [Deltaproteobacteria bacterium]MBT6492048.1 acyl-CoA/acyl-ACP dehydrogenase [Deltaproteobacteria bacterium]